MARSKTVEVKHPATGEVSKIRVPAHHDGSRIKVEFPDGVIAYTDGFDPAERAAAFPGAPPAGVETLISTDAGALSEGR